MGIMRDLTFHWREIARKRIRGEAAKGNDVKF